MTTTWPAPNNPFCAIRSAATDRPLVHISRHIGVSTHVSREHH